VYAVIWVGILVYLGYLGYQSTETMMDLSLARGDWGPVVLGFSTAATMASAATILGLPGIVYGAGGYPGLWTSIAKWPAFGLGIIVFAKSIRRLGIQYGSLSVPDWLGHLYDNDIIRVIAALLVTFQGAWVVAQIAGVSQIVSGLTAISYQTAVVGAAIVIFGYTLVGGESAVQSSDFFQGILMIIVVVMAVLSGFWLIEGGLLGVSEAVAAQDGNLGMFAPQFPILDGPIAVLAWGTFFFGLTISAPVGKKFLSLNDESEIKTYIATIIVTMMIWDLAVLPGLYSVALFPGLEAADQAMVQVIGTAFPAIVAAGLAFAVISASVSTVDSVIIALTVSYTNDIYRRFLVDNGYIHSEKSEEELDRYTVWLSRGFILVIAVIGGVLAATPPDFIAVLVTFGNFGFISAVFAPIALGLFWDQANAKGALASLIVAPIVYLYLNFFVITSTPFKPGLYTMILAFVLMVVVSYVTEGQTEPVRQAEAVGGD
jgi:sodium/proline symporter